MFAWVKHASLLGLLKPKIIKKIKRLLDTNALAYFRTIYLCPPKKFYKIGLSDRGKQTFKIIFFSSFLN
jgi:hypothetical protein